MKNLKLILTQGLVLAQLAGCSGYQAAEPHEELDPGSGTTFETAALDNWAAVVGLNPTRQEATANLDNERVYVPVNFTFKNIGTLAWNTVYTRYRSYSYRPQVKIFLDGQSSDFFIFDDGDGNCDIRDKKVNGIRPGGYYTDGLSCQLRFSRPLETCATMRIQVRMIYQDSAYLWTVWEFGEIREIQLKVCPNPESKPVPTPTPEPTEPGTPAPGPETPPTGPAPGPSPVSGRISLQADDRQYVCAEGGGGQNLMANRNAVGAWEIFGLSDLNGGALEHGDQIHLQADNGRYVTRASFLDSDRLVAVMKSGEAFTIERLDGPGEVRMGDRIALKASNGKFVAAENGGGDILRANRDQAQSWETFTLRFE